MRGRAVSVTARQSRDGKTYWIVVMENEDGTQSGELLCFDAKIRDVGTGYFEYTTNAKENATFLNFPKEGGQAAAAGARPAALRKDDPKTRLLSAHTMLLSYAKDHVANWMPPSETDEFGASLTRVREAYEFFHNLLFSDAHVRDFVMKE